MPAFLERNRNKEGCARAFSRSGFNFGGSELFSSGGLRRAHAALLLAASFVNHTCAEENGGNEGPVPFVARGCANVVRLARETRVRPDLIMNKSRLPRAAHLPRAG